MYHSHILVERTVSNRWFVELVLRYSDEKSKANAMTTCARWHYVASISSIWEVNEENEESCRLHCCARGRYLAFTYSVSAQKRRERRRLEQRVETLSLQWQAEKLPYVQAIQWSRTCLRLLYLIVSVLICSVLEASEALLFFLWPVRFTWHAFRVARLAYPVVILDSWLSTSFPLAHALAAPDALVFRRYLFFTSCVCFFLCLALLLAWWRVLFYLLGALSSEVFGLKVLDLALHEANFRSLSETSVILHDLKAKEKELKSFLSSFEHASFFQTSHIIPKYRPRVNPYRGQDPIVSKERLSRSQRRPKRKPYYRCFTTNFSVYINTKLMKRMLRLASDLHRLVLIFLLFVLSALFAVVTAKKKHDLLLFASPSLNIVFAAISQDVLPLLFVILKLTLHLCKACLLLLFRFLLSPLGLLSSFASLFFLTKSFHSLASENLEPEASPTSTSGTAAALLLGSEDLLCASNNKAVLRSSSYFSSLLYQPEKELAFSSTVFTLLFSSKYYQRLADMLTQKRGSLHFLSHKAVNNTNLNKATTTAEEDPLSSSLSSLPTADSDSHHHPSSSSSSSSTAILSTESAEEAAAY